MRTFKFRGIGKRTGTWIYGNLIQLGGAYIIVPIYDEYEVVPDHSTECALGFHEDEFDVIEPDSLGQFTGANDAYGNEIYEGDILHIPDDDFNGEIKGVVMFEADSFVVKSIRSNWSALLAWCNRKDHETKHYVRPTKVIGNTYENQELLKQ